MSDTQIQSEWKAKARCSRHIVVQFTGHLSLLLKNGVGMAEALETLSHQSEDPNFGAVAHDLVNRVNAGHSLSQAVRDYPLIFPTLYVSMIRLGEATGKLTNCLDSLCHWVEADDKTSKKVVSLFAYPVLVLLVTSLLTVLLFQTIIPQFFEIFRNEDMELPLLTKLVMLTSDLLANPGTYLFALTAALVGIFSFRKYWAQLGNAASLTRYFMKVPLAGAAFQHASIARFSSAAEMAISTGIDVLLSLELGCQASGNKVMEFELEAFKEAIAQGESLSSYTKASPELWGHCLPQLLAAGEESGALPEMLAHGRDFHQAELEYIVDNLSAVIEPILLFTVAIIVGLIILSVFIPLYSLVGSLGA